MPRQQRAWKTDCLSAQERRRQRLHLGSQHAYERRITMAGELMDPHRADDGALCTTPERLSPEESSPFTRIATSLSSEMSPPVLAAHCLGEIDNFRRGQPCTERYGLELFHRAIMLSDQEAWAWVQQCFAGLVQGWVRRHPKRVVACRLEGEENYVAQAFERFWQATASNQRVEFSTLAAALQYLRASLNGVILDTLRSYARPREIRLSESGEPHMEDVTSSSEVWDILKTLLSKPREVRLAYLLFHCGLKPREIVHFCLQEFDDVREVYCLLRTIIERLLRNADLLRWRLS